MSADTVGAAISALAESDLLKSNLTVVWHAGEPLVIAPDKLAELLGVVVDSVPPEVKLQQAIQSNLTALTEEHCEVLRSLGVRVGVSIDGPDWLHDQYRVDRQGRGTHFRTMKGLELLRQKGFAFNIIAVLTDASLSYPDEMFDFFVTTGAAEIAFNIDEVEGQRAGSSLPPSAVNLGRYIDFLARFISLMDIHGVSFELRERRHFLDLIASGKRVGVNQQADPFRILSVAWDGQYSTFSPELLGQADPRTGATFTLGNVGDGPILDTYDRERFRQLQQEISAGVSNCRKECDFFDLCGGGAPSNKLFENFSFSTTETGFCKYTIQANLEVVVPWMEKGIYVGSGEDT